MCSEMSFLNAKRIVNIFKKQRTSPPVLSRQASEETRELRQDFSYLTTSSTLPTISNPVSSNPSAPVFIPKTTVAERQFDLRHRLNDRRLRRQQRDINTSDYFVDTYFNEYNRDAR